MIRRQRGADAATPPPRLSRFTLPPEHTRLRRTPPVRIVHLGLGAFHRSHQAWYTDAVDERGQWGIAAFTGRASGREETLAAQQGLYTLLERAPEGDRASIVGSIAAAESGMDVASIAARFADPRVVITTLTVTEAGYHAAPDGAALVSAAVDADVELLRKAGPEGAAPPVTTLPGRLLLGLNARRRAGGAPIAVVPCDNLPSNGQTLRRLLLTVADRVDSALARWISRDVSFVSTVVDRITPATTADDLLVALQATGREDLSPVVAEPFHDWLLQGEFPLGRPCWEDVGARFVPDVEPFERRKLRMLNGAHTVLACHGLLHGYTTVAEAVSDPGVLRLVEEFWDEAARTLPPEVDSEGYRRELLARFRNSRIRHRLDQIATDSRLKVRLRIVPVLEAERAAGRSGQAALTAVAGWLRLDERENPGRSRRTRLALLDERIARDAQLRDAIITAADSR